MVEIAVVPVPNRTSFPGPSSIHYHNGGFIQTGVGIRTDGVGQMMVHKSHLRIGLTKVVGESSESTILVRHAGIEARGIKDIQVSGGILSPQKTLQIGCEDADWVRPALADEIEL